MVVVHQEERPLERSSIEHRVVDAIDSLLSFVHNELTFGKRVAGHSEEIWFFGLCAFFCQLHINSY
jgi:hypothetical protein